MRLYFDWLLKIGNQNNQLIFIRLGDFRKNGKKRGRKVTTIVYLQTKTDEVVNCPLNLCKFSNGRLAKMSHNALKHSRSNTTEESFEHDKRKKRPFHT